MNTYHMMTEGASNGLRPDLEDVLVLSKRHCKAVAEGLTTAAALIARGWAHNPSERPSMEEILETVEEGGALALEKASGLRGRGRCGGSSRSRPGSHGRLVNSAPSCGCVVQ